MKYRSRIYYTETDKALMWDRWQKGEFEDSPLYTLCALMFWPVRGISCPLLADHLAAVMLSTRVYSAQRQS